MTDAVKMAKEAAGRVLHDKVYAEARERHLNDATQSGFDHHMVRVAGEHAAAYALSALEQAVEPVAEEREKLAGEQGEQCERCQGNGEIVTDWDRYMHAHDGDVGDEAVADCPDCSGTGRIEDKSPLPTLQRLGQEFDAGEAEPVGLREAVYRFLSDYDDSDRADAGNGPLMELHIAEFRKALATPSQPDPQSRELSDNQIDTAKAGAMDQAADFCIRTLAKALGVDDWEQADGSETWDGDVAGTIYNVLKSGRVYDDEDGRVARLEDATQSRGQAFDGDGEACKVLRAISARMTIACDWTKAGKDHIKVRTADWHVLMEIGHQARALSSAKRGEEG